MIILGIDPGTTQIGYGIVKSESNRLTGVAYGIIKNTGTDKHADLLKTEKELSAIIKKYKPERAGIEKLFFFKNQKTVISVSEMRGVLLLTLTRHQLPILEFTPLQVKQNISAYGRAQKDQVLRMVQLILGIKEAIKPDDAADALAIAICAAGNI